MHIQTSPIVLLIALAAHSCYGAQVKLNDGKILNVDNPKDITPTVEKEKPNSIKGLSARDLFGRQYCSAPGQNVICSTGCCSNDEYCCENTSCIDITTRLCCADGGQCYKDGDCCSDGNCCDPGKYCVIDLETNEHGCLPYGGSSGATYSSVAFTAAASATTTPAPTTAPATTAAPPPPSSSFVCDDAGYGACADQKYCCPIGDYCFYDSYGAPRCWGGSLYYTFYYYYSWSYTFGIRYYTTSTEYYLGGTASVPALTTPPAPTAAPATSDDDSGFTYTPVSVPSFSYTPLSIPSAPGGSLPGGAPASTEAASGTPFGFKTPTNTQNSFPTPTSTLRSGDGPPSSGGSSSSSGDSSASAVARLVTPGIVLASFFLGSFLWMLL